MLLSLTWFSAIFTHRPSQNGLCYEVGLTRVRLTELLHQIGQGRFASDHVSCSVSRPVSEMILKGAANRGGRRSNVVALRLWRSVAPMPVIHGVDRLPP